MAGTLCLLAVSGCGERRDTIKLAGETMGTSWHVTVVPGPGVPSGDVLTRGIEDALEQVNRSMSTYRDDSEISRFNATEPGTWFDVSEDFYAVLSTALAVGWQSSGAYDVTVGPLVDLWGFGPGGAIVTPPPDDAVSSLLTRVGQNRLRLDGENLRLLKQGEVSLDLSSIAKGYAVDRVALWLSAQGIANYLVEVGGEMRLSGVSGRGDAWRIAIERPDSTDRAPDQAIRLTNVAVATSGDYRNFFEIDGHRYSHSIDPRTGYPVSHDLVSVTVVDSSAMLADAWATALTILGFEEGMAVARDRGLAVYFIQRRGDGFHSAFTPVFGQFLESSGPQD